MIKDKNKNGNKEQLSTILNDLVYSFIRCGDDKWEDELDAKNKGNYIEYSIDSSYQIKASFYNGIDIDSMITQAYNIMPLIYLMQYLEKHEPNVTFSKFAKFNITTQRIVLYFKSDPESFNAFTNGIYLKDVILALDNREQTQQNQQNDTDGQDR